MEITINDHRKIFAVQEEFSQTFPFLKLEFYEKPHQSDGKSFAEHTVGSSKTLGECRTMHTEGTLHITPGMSVTELEENFADIHGLTVRVFRKSGNGWIESSSNMTSLEKQNEEITEASHA